MLLEVEKAVGYPLPTSAMFQGETIRRLALEIAEQVSPEGPYACFNMDGDQPPLFIFLHSDLTEGTLVVRRLLRLLAQTQPVFLVEPHGLRGEPVPCSIEQMAMERMQLVLSHQPNGPYRLIGSCKGALIAFEVARLLTQAGNRVELIGLIDPPTPMPARLCGSCCHWLSMQRHLLDWHGSTIR